MCSDSINTREIRVMPVALLVGTAIKSACRVCVARPHSFRRNPSCCSGRFHGCEVEADSGFSLAGSQARSFKTGLIVPCRTVPKSVSRKLLRLDFTQPTCRSQITGTSLYTRGVLPSMMAAAKERMTVTELLFFPSFARAWLRVCECAFHLSAARSFGSVALRLIEGTAI